MTAQAFFLPLAAGERFCLYHPAAGTCRAALLYVHPFAEEMHKSRRMAAQAARALAARGVAVLQIDLLGCGDSSGDFGDADWDSWKQDLAAAYAWLRERCGVTPGLWGLRVGALLALDFARTAAPAPARLLLWQPVTNGAAFLTQFLRLRTAAAMLEGDASQAGTAAARAALHAGEALEVAGYRLAPALALALEQADAAAWAPPAPVDWFELTAQPGRAPAPAALATAAAWQRLGAAAQPQALAGPAFWSSQEIEEAPVLLAATLALFDGDAHAD